MAKHSNLLSILKTVILFSLLFLTPGFAAAQEEGPQCDLATSKDGPVQAQPNSNLTYQITISNNGPDVATNAKLTDTLPTSLTFVSITAPAQWSCTTPQIGTTGEIVCSNPFYYPGTTDTFTLVVHSGPADPNSNFITNKVSATSDTFDLNTENDESSATTLVSGSTTANVGIQLFANHQTALAGTNITYTLNIFGTAGAPNVTLTDPLPGTMTFVSMSSPQGWNCSQPSPGTNGTITCSISSLDQPNAEFTIIGQIPQNTTSDTVFTNTATISTSAFDPNAEDDAASTATTVLPNFTLTILNGTDQTTPISTTFSLPLKLTVKDESGNPAPNVSITFQAPATGPSAIFFSNGSTSESVITDTNGIATSSILRANTLAGGPYNISALAGSSASTTFTLTNTKGSQSITFPSIATKTYGDPSFNLVANASSDLPVTFNVLSGPATLNNSTVSILGAGTITIRAFQPGDDNYNAATPIDRQLTVLKAIPTIAVATSKTPSDYGEAVTFTATIAGPPNTTAPSGTVQFKDGSANLGSPVTCIAGANLCTVQLSTNNLTSGTHQISANYSGDTNFTQAASTLREQVIKLLPIISIGDLSQTESNSGTTKFDFTVSLSATSSLVVQVDYVTTDGTASLANNDYQTAAGTLTFNPGERTKLISVLVNGDLNRESNETFFVNLSNPHDATISKNQGSGTIVNDDTEDPPQILLEANAADPRQAAALDSVLFLRDPFPVKSAATWLNLGPDRNTRLIIFASNLQLAQNEQANAVTLTLLDATGASYDVMAEHVRTSNNLTSLTQITFRLPNDLASGPCGITIKFRGLFSNQGVIRIQ